MAGVPTPAFASSLSYYDGLRAERSTAALIQGQRDLFGAHTYRRVDRVGTFHTKWSTDRAEIGIAGVAIPAGQGRPTTGG
jgi:6-phosphogluconate dehydrogenase